MIGYGETFGVSPLEVERIRFCDFCDICDDWLMVSAEREEAREAREKERDRTKRQGNKTTVTVPVVS